MGQQKNVSGTTIWTWCGLEKFGPEGCGRCPDAQKLWDKECGFQQVSDSQDTRKGRKGP